MRFAAARLGLLVQSYDGELVTVVGRFAGTVALDELFARCRAVDRVRWPAMVLEAFERIARSVEIGPALRHWATAAPLLRTRVVTEGSLLVEEAVGRPFGDGLIEILVADAGGAVTPLSPTLVAGWDMPVDELLRRGRAAVLDHELPSVRSLDLGPVTALVLETPTVFAAVHLNALPAYADIGAAGALVALPTRHLVLVVTITGRSQALDAAQALLVNAELLEGESPAPLSPDLWWWRAGALVRLPGTPTDLRPPRAFLDVLGELGS